VQQLPIDAASQLLRIGIVFADFTTGGVKDS